MIRGKIVLDKRTKELVKRIKPHQIAVIKHQDLDQIASKSLVEKQVQAVLNQSTSMTGKYPNSGPSILINAGIPLFDIKDKNLFSVLGDGDIIQIKNNKIFYKNKFLAVAKPIRKELVNNMISKAVNNLNNELIKFIDNTLEYADQEKEMILNLKAPDINLNLKNKHVLVVVRGADYKDDLTVINNYIKEVKPVIIGVDGGADACLEVGYKSDIIIGDMDSVSDKALKKTNIIIVHAYPDGRAPGLDRIKKLKLDYKLYPAPGTSEDIALMLAYQKGADIITAVGTHSHMIDFLEKGRNGMSSTLLTRLKVGSKLVDAKGVSKLYQSKIHYHYWLQVILAIFIPLLIISFFSPPIKQLVQLLILRIKIYFHF